MVMHARERERDIYATIVCAAPVARSHLALAVYICAQLLYTLLCAMTCMCYVDKYSYIIVHGEYAIGCAVCVQFNTGEPSASAIFFLFISSILFLAWLVATDWRGRLFRDHIYYSGLIRLESFKWSAWKK